MSWGDDPEARRLISEQLAGKMRLEPTSEHKRFKTFGGEFTAPVRSYLSYPYLPLSTNLVFDARGGVGKTSLLLAAAAMLSQGLEPITHKPLAPAKSLFLMGDADDPEDYEAIYRACGGKPGMITYIEQDDVPRFDDSGLEEISSWLKAGKFKLLIGDPFFSLLGGVVKDTKDDEEARAITRKLNRMAKETETCCCWVRHMTKGSVGQSLVTLGAGSQQYVDKFRGQLVAEPSPKQKGVVIVRDMKGSIRVPKGEPFAYRRVGDEIQFVENFIDPEDKEASSNGQEESASDKRKTDECKQSIYSYLLGGERLSSDLDHATSLGGFSQATVRRAKKQMGVVSWQMDRQWWVRLPEGYDPFADT